MLKYLGVVFSEETTFASRQELLARLPSLTSLNGSMVSQSMLQWKRYLIPSNALGQMNRKCLCVLIFVENGTESIVVLKRGNKPHNVHDIVLLLKTRGIIIKSDPEFYRGGFFIFFCNHPSSEWYCASVGFFYFSVCFFGPLLPDFLDLLLFLLTYGGNVP